MGMYASSRLLDLLGKPFRCLPRTAGEKDFGAVGRQFLGNCGVAMLDTAYLGHVIVLWSWALTQPNPEAAESATVRFRSLDGRDREIAVPRLTFTEPITTLPGASAWQPIRAFTDHVWLTQCPIQIATLDGTIDQLDNEYEDVTGRWIWPRPKRFAQRTDQRIQRQHRPTAVAG
jgi:hypothetical protein